MKGEAKGGATCCCACSCWTEEPCPGNAAGAYPATAWLRWCGEKSCGLEAGWGASDESDACSVTCCCCNSCIACCCCCCCCGYPPRESPTPERPPLPTLEALWRSASLRKARFAAMASAEKSTPPAAASGVAVGPSEAPRVGALAPCGGAPLPPRPPIGPACPANNGDGSGEGTAIPREESSSSNCAMRCADVARICSVAASCAASWARKASTVRPISAMATPAWTRSCGEGGQKRGNSVLTKVEEQPAS